MNIENINRLKKIEEELERWLPANIETIAKSTLAEEIFPGIGKDINALTLDSLFAPLKDILSRGGKLWRPLLMTLICETLGGGDSAIPFAPLVEFCHNASLIHDDIEDDSDERRGKPAIHHIYGIDAAINSGSFSYFMSLCCIEAYKGKNKDCIYKLWAEYMRRLHLGQAMDISWHRDIKIIPDIDDYFMMCGMKTGSLARFAAELGAYTAGASTDAARYLGEAAEKLGIGFQILDDVKNLTTGIPGKKRGDDIVEGKKSYPVLLYLHRYPKKRDRILYCLYEARTNGFMVPEIQEMIEILASAGVLKEAEEKSQLLVNEVREIFNLPQYAGFPASEKGRALLDDLINTIS